MEVFGYVVVASKDIVLVTLRFMCPRNDDFVNPRNFQRPIHHMLDDWLPIEVRKDLSRKTRARESSLDNTDDVH